MSKFYKVSIEVRSGGERIAGGTIYATGADEDQVREVAAQATYDHNLAYSPTWDEIYPEKSFHLLKMAEVGRRDVPTSSILYTPDILPSAPAPR